MEGLETTGHIVYTGKISEGKVSWALVFTRTMCVVEVWQSHSPPGRGWSLLGKQCSLGCQAWLKPPRHSIYLGCSVTGVSWTHGFHQTDRQGLASLCSLGQSEGLEPPGNHAIFGVICRIRVSLECGSDLDDWSRGIPSSVGQWAVLEPPRQAVLSREMCGPGALRECCAH